ETAALGFRVKSGWAAVVLISGSARSLRIRDCFTIDLCDPKIPATRQPYHAAMGKLESNVATVNARVRIVRAVAKRSMISLFADCRRKSLHVARAGIVVGSQIDPSRIAIGTSGRTRSKANYFAISSSRICGRRKFQRSF